VTKYALIAGLVACLGLGGAAWWFQASAARLRAENKVLSARLFACDARSANLEEDKKSDATVNDPSEFDVPDHWLRPEGAAPN